MDGSHPIGVAARHPRLAQGMTVGPARPELSPRDVPGRTDDRPGPAWRSGAGRPKEAGPVAALGVVLVGDPSHDGAAGVSAARVGGPGARRGGL